MVRVLSSLQRFEQAAIGKLDGLEAKPLAEPFNTDASEAQSRSASDSPARPALHGALSWQTTADAGLGQDRVISTQESCYTTPRGGGPARRSTVSGPGHVSGPGKSCSGHSTLRSACVSCSLVHAVCNCHVHPSHRTIKMSNVPSKTP